jgi:hypothetical protein
MARNSFGYAGLLGDTKNSPCHIFSTFEVFATSGQYCKRGGLPRLATAALTE